MRRKGEAGFTLIELLVCVAIIGLLVSLSIPRVGAAIMSARQAQVQADLKLIHTALTQHYLDRGYYPNKLNNLKTAGYLPARMTFTSPVSGHYYFYAVDDTTGTRAAKAFVLGAPPSNAGDEMHLYHAGPLPRGQAPSLTATAWIQNGEDLLNLYTADDESILPPGSVPRDLSDYRNSCKPASTTPCDLWTN